MRQSDYGSTPTPSEMTPEILIAHVEESLTKALAHQSWIDESVLRLKGFSTGVQRRLVSNLCHLPKFDPCYLEVGLFCGATFCAALNHSPYLTAVGVEDFSQDFGDPEVRSQLLANLAIYSGQAKSATLVDADCFKWSKEELRQPVDVFYFDGEHSFASQASALPAFLDQLAPLFVFMVDDTNWTSVAEGTRQGFVTLKDRVQIERSWHLEDDRRQDGPNWHNGVDLFVCRKC